MSDSREKVTEYTGVHYSRSEKRKHKRASINKDIIAVSDDELSFSETRLNWTHYMGYLLLSLVVSLSTVVLPVVGDFANGLQTQHLYTGMAMGQGYMPYSTVFATGGFFYYSLIGLFSHFGMMWALALIQLFSLFYSGVYFEKLLIRLTTNDSVGQGPTIMFYLLQLGLGFGGLYPIQWAMPFMLMGLLILGNYVVGMAKDEHFIVYGILTSCSLLIDPRTLPFWLLSFVLILGYNLSQKRFVRGFYQFLAFLLGFAITTYIALYFVLNLQILSPMLSQTVFYPWTSLAIEAQSLWMAMAIQLFVLVISGVLMGLLVFPSLVREQSPMRIMFALLFVTSLFYLVVAMFTRTFWLYPLLYPLPFTLLLAFSWVTKEQEREEIRRPKLLNVFLKKQFFLPLLTVLALVAYPVGMGMLEAPLRQERDELAAYVKQKVTNDQNIYVWDVTGRIYLQSNHFSATQLPLPLIYTSDASNAHLLEDELLQRRAHYIFVNKAVSLPKSVDKEIATHYKKVALPDLTYFSVYRLND